MLILTFEDPLIIIYCDAVMNIRYVKCIWTMYSCNSYSCSIDSIDEFEYYVAEELNDAKISIVDVYRVMFYFGPHFYTCIHKISVGLNVPLNAS